VGPVFSLGATMRCRENSQKCGGDASSEDSTAHSPALAQCTKYLGFDSSAHTQDLELKKLCIRWPQSVWFMDLRGPVRAPRTKPALGFNFVVVID
jgi:hypothetical protein